MSVDRIRNLSSKDFSSVRHFPGTAGSPFDRVLHSLEKFDHFPNWTFIGILFILAFLGGRFELFKSAWLLFCFLTDWLLIRLLPLLKLSYGPVKPVVLMLAFLRFPFAFLPSYWNLGFELIGTSLVLYGFYFEPFFLDIHHEIFHSTKFLPGQSIRIVHLGDLHLEHWSKRESAVLQSLHKIQPDLILFSGDILNLSYLHDPDSLKETRIFLDSLNAKVGVYGVSGSPAVDLQDLFPRLVENTLLQWLNNNKTLIELGSTRVQIYGLSCTHNPQQDYAALQALLDDSGGFDPNCFNLLLHHSPDLAPLSSQLGFDLQLSGHTHGGQIRLPVIGPFYTGSLYRKALEAGRYLVNGMTLYVTRGLGMEGAIAPRVRFLCRPEIVIWEIGNK